MKTALQRHCLVLERRTLPTIGPKPVRPVGQARLHLQEDHSGEEDVDGDQDGDGDTHEISTFAARLLVGDAIADGARIDS